MLSKPLTVALALLAANPANAQSIWTAPPAKWNSSIPPPRFQGPGAVVAIFAPEDEIRGLCWDGPLDPNVTIYACIREVNGKGRKFKVMILPLPCPYAYKGETFARLTCHEFAHANRTWKHEAE